MASALEHCLLSMAEIQPWGMLISPILIANDSSLQKWFAVNKISLQEYCFLSPPLPTIHSDLLTASNYFVIFLLVVWLSGAHLWANNSDLFYMVWWAMFLKVKTSQLGGQKPYVLSSLISLLSFPCSIWCPQTWSLDHACFVVSAVLGATEPSPQETECTGLKWDRGLDISHPLSSESSYPLEALCASSVKWGLVLFEHPIGEWWEGLSGKSWKSLVCPSWGPCFCRHWWVLLLL